MCLCIGCYPLKLPGTERYWKIISFTVTSLGKYRLGQFNSYSELCQISKMERFAQSLS